MIKLIQLLEATPDKNDTPSTNKDIYIDRQTAKKYYDELKYDFDFDEFFDGMNVEMEHKDVTGGDPVATAKIAAAHLREVPNYYTLLKKYVEK